jgi:flagellar assembly protein FliH
MSKFKTQDFSIKNETKESGEVRIVKVDTGSAPQVSAYSLPELSIRGKGNYSAVKAKFGSLAATDEDRRVKSTKDRRFSVNSLLRDPLSIEVEERRVIERRIQEQVVQERELARVEGNKKGYEDGLKKGKEEGLAEFRSQSAAALESFQEFVSSFEATKTEVFKANERFLMDLVFQVAKMITLKELSTDKDYVVRLARTLMERVGIRENVKIKINQNDAASLDTLKADLTNTFSDLKNLAIEVSEDVKSGGCLIETQWSAIDATIETQLKGIQEALIGGTNEA